MSSQPVNVIHRRNATSTSSSLNSTSSLPKDAPSQPYTYYPIAIIGAGESGICMAAKLRREFKGFDQFRIFERRSALGGTWSANRYPGIACDVPAILYSFSFCQNPKWTALFPSGKEICQYLYDVCVKYQILDKIQCNTSVKTMRWLEEEKEWELILEHLAPEVGDMSTAERRAIEAGKGSGATVIATEFIRAKCVVSAVGGLVEPKPPVELPGKDGFQGRVLHTASWDPKVDLKDKDVVVIGTGCSAAQVVPKLIDPEHGPVKSVTQLLRSPPWVVHVFDRKTTQIWEEWIPWLSIRIPGFQNTVRKMFFTVIELEFLSLFSIGPNASERRKAKGEELMTYMRRKVPAEYHDILTPNYEVFCKRRVVDEGWFSALRDPRVSITSMPLTSYGPGPREVTLGPGRNYPPLVEGEEPPTETKVLPCDVLVMANGYTTNEFLHPLDVVGKNGVSMHDVWKQRGGAQSYLGLAMDEFPNFFMLFGPNTATGHSSVILASENAASYALKFIRPLINSEISTFEPTHHAVSSYTAELQRLLRLSIFNSGGCVNWYADRKTGWNASVYPRSQIDHTIRCMFVRWSHWRIEYTRKGLLRMWARRLVKGFNVLAITLVGLWAWRRGARNAKKDVTGWISELVRRLKA